jgi:hypothetical protein
MTSSTRRRRFALAIAAAILALSAGVMTAVYAHPRDVPSGLLGATWQCQQVLWVTSCERVPTLRPGVAPAVRSWRREPVDLRQV